MIAIDANIIVRVFIDDKETQQVTAARNLVSKAKHVYLSFLVLAEMVWVLTRAYGLNKPQILHILQEIYENAAFILDDKDVLRQAIAFFQDNTVDFSDCLILVNAQAANAQLYTFDAKLSRLNGVKKL